MKTNFKFKRKENIVVHVFLKRKYSNHSSSKNFKGLQKTLEKLFQNVDKNGMQQSKDERNKHKP